MLSRFRLELIFGGAPSSCSALSPCTGAADLDTGWARKRRTAGRFLPAQGRDRPHGGGAGRRRRCLSETGRVAVRNIYYPGRRPARARHRIADHCLSRGIPMARHVRASALYLAGVIDWGGGRSWAVSAAIALRRFTPPPSSYSEQESAFSCRCSKGRSKSGLASPEELIDACQYDALFHGFTVVLTFHHLLLIVAAGALLGISRRAAGSRAPNGVRKITAAAHVFNGPDFGDRLLTALTGRACSGRLRPRSILFNIPGEPSSVATTFYGYPLARARAGDRGADHASIPPDLARGRGCRHHAALELGRATFALRFGPPEYFAVYFLAFASFIAFWWRRAALKTLISISCSRGSGSAWSGMDTVSGSMRLTFDIPEFIRGVSFLVVVDLACSVWRAVP